MGLSIPKINISHPKATIEMIIQFLRKNEIINNPAQQIIPEINKITQVIFSFLLIMKYER